MAIRGSPNIITVGCYAPTAQRPTEEHAVLYTMLLEVVHRQGYQVVYVLGYCNAMIHISQEGEHPHIGEQSLCRDFTNLEEQTGEVSENMGLFM